MEKLSEVENAAMGLLSGAIEVTSLQVGWLTAGSLRLP